MAMPLITVLKFLNEINNLSFYPVLMKFATKCLICQDISFQIQSLPTGAFLGIRVQGMRYSTLTGL